MNIEQAEQLISSKQFQQLKYFQEKTNVFTIVGQISLYMIKSDSADLSLKMLFDMNLDRVRFETEYGTFMELALPNKEIQRVYNTEILSWLRGTVDDNVMAGLEKSLYR